MLQSAAGSFIVLQSEVPQTLTVLCKICVRKKLEILLHIGGCVMSAVNFCRHVHPMLRAKSLLLVKDEYFLCSETALNY